MGWHCGWGSGWGWIMMIGMILFWVLIIGAMVWLAIVMFRRPGGIAGGPGAGNETPLEILKKRFARGEISRDEYERMKRDLE
jgi:putative membrane protein